MYAKIIQLLFTPPTGRYRKVLGWTYAVAALVSLSFLYEYPNSRLLFVVGVSSIASAAYYFLKKDKLPAPAE